MYQWTDERYNPAVVDRIKADWPRSTRIRHRRDGRHGTVMNWRRHNRWNRARGESVWNDQVYVLWDIPDDGVRWVRGSRNSWVDTANVEVLDAVPR